MIVLGVDPGTLVTGYGVIESRNGKVTMLECDAIKNPSVRLMPQRLMLIFERLCEVIERYHPHEFAIETAFYGRNAQSALKLGHARGVAMLAAVMRKLPTAEYSPREVKKAIVGTGAASKDQVQYMVKSLLRMKSTPRFYDTTDALAVALCHLSRRDLHRRVDRPRRSRAKSAIRFRDWKAYVKSRGDKSNPRKLQA